LFQEFKEFMNQACKDFNCVRFNLSGNGEVLIFNEGKCEKFKIVW